MSARMLHRLGLAGIVLSVLVILYVTLAPEPPHWGTLFPGEATPAAEGPAAPPPRPITPPGWTEAEEEAVGHALVFGALGVASSLVYATSARARRAPQRTLVMTVLLLWLFAGLTESLQAFLPTRSPALDDLAWDVLGALLGFFGGAVLWRLLLTRLGIARRPEGARDDREPAPPRRR